MDLGIKDKVFLVTGGAEGIGRSIALGISAEGGIPVIAGRAKEAGEELVAKIRKEGKEAYSIFKDLGTPERCKEVIDTCLAQYQRLDGLINNAGGNDSVSLETGSPEAWMHSLENNLHHYFFLAHYALPSLKSSRGVILNISSKTAITGQGGTSPYAASKGAHLALTREWAVELLKYRIRVNCIVPSEVMTPMYRKWIDTFDDSDAKIREIEGRIPFESRMTTSEEIADAALFLISQRASHITGQHYFVDGGYVHLDRAFSVLKDS